MVKISNHDLDEHKQSSRLFIDAAFIRPDHDTKGLVVRTVRREHLLAAVPASHPLGRAPAVQPSGRPI
jgi:DNA-binding transcriptional LysR family regulator